MRSEKALTILHLHHIKVIRTHDMRHRARLNRADSSWIAPRMEDWRLKIPGKLLPRIFNLQSWTRFNLKRADSAWIAFAKASIPQVLFAHATTYRVLAIVRAISQIPVSVSIMSNRTTEGHLLNQCNSNPRAPKIRVNDCEPSLIVTSVQHYPQYNLCH